MDQTKNNEKILLLGHCIFCIIWEKTIQNTNIRVAYGKILNRLGHTANYHTIEELETELPLKQQNVVTAILLEWA